jgi:hypothetical protein
MWSPMATTSSIAVKNRTRVVAALLDVRRKRRPAQRGAHLLGDGVIQVLEDLKFDRIAPHEAIVPAGGQELFAKRDGCGVMVRPTTNDE